MRTYIMKIAVSGKGGSGKTTIAAYLSRIYSEKNFDVLAVDADPSLNLSALFGHEDITPISEMKSLAGERASLPGGLVRMNPRVDDLVDRYSVQVSKNLRLLASGTVTKAGSGCLCSENSLLRSLLGELVMSRDGIVILDMEAGLEIMSRGTLRNIDAILAVTEPNYSSISVTKKLLKFADELGIKNSYVIGNKIRDGGNQLGHLSDSFDIFHAIPYSEEIHLAAMEKNRFLARSGFYDSVCELAHKLTNLNTISTGDKNV
jgi:CO dehydrogenase maturation factor